MDVSITDTDVSITDTDVAITDVDVSTIRTDVAADVEVSITVAITDYTYACAYS